MTSRAGFVAGGAGNRTSVRRFAIAIAVSLAGMAAASSAAASLPTLLASDGNGYRVRPSSIYDTGDGSGVIGVLRPRFGEHGPGRGVLRWTRWTRTEASATGSYWLKLGTPTATSPFTRTAVSVAATRVRDGHFTRMRLRYRQRGRSADVTLCVPDRTRSSEWQSLLGGRCL